MRLIALLLTLSALSGCSLLIVSEIGQPATFSPVEGPLAAHSPVPAYNGRFRGLTSGKVTVTLASGERFQGIWRLTRTRAAPDLTAAWDFVYGPGYYRANVLGTRYYARALLTGSRGSTAVVEVHYANPGLPAGLGVARDSSGNVYKSVILPLTRSPC